MNGTKLHLFRLLGFNVSVHISWLIIFIIVVWSLAGIVFPQQYPDLSTTVYLIMGVAAAIGLFLSIVWHELCHSLVARRYGLAMRGITLFLFGGIAEMHEEPASPKAEFLMALAGPASSILLGIVMIGLGFAAAAANASIAVIAVLKWLGLINIVLAIFNLVPGFPLDGGRVLRSIIWHFKKDLRAATKIASDIGAGFGALLIGLGILLLLAGGDVVGGLWWILIGMFLRGVAKQSYQQVVIKNALSGENVRHFMNNEPVTVSPETSLRDLLEHYIYRYHFKMFPVTVDHELRGCVTINQLKEIPRERWNSTTVAEIVSSCSKENTVAPDQDAMAALQQMQENQVSRIMVVDGDTLVGILSLKDLLEYLSLKMELETE